MMSLYSLGECLYSLFGEHGDRKMSWMEGFDVSLFENVMSMESRKGRSSMECMRACTTGQFLILCDVVRFSVKSLAEAIVLST
jgi:hypothetical protein